MGKHGKMLHGKTLEKIIFNSNAKAFEFTTVNKEENAINYFLQSSRRKTIS